MNNETKIRDLFRIGDIYNVFYTRFPHEVVPCRGRLTSIDEYEGGVVHFKFLTGTFAGGYGFLSMDEFFRWNYSLERIPVIQEVEED